MVIHAFPPIELADKSGLLAVGGDLDLESLLLAYRQGIFPWPVDARHLLWFAPPQRAVLFLKDLHIPRSLLRERKKNKYTFRLNSDFEFIISACAASDNRRAQSGTWITPQMKEAYIRLFHQGYAFCAACYENELPVGGLYGVVIGHMIAGESMFYRRPNASKLALLFLVEHLKSDGIPWIDCQVMTPLLKSFGAVLVGRSRFTKMLQKQVQQPQYCFLKS